MKFLKRSQRDFYTPYVSFNQKSAFDPASDFSMHLEIMAKDCKYQVVSILKKQEPGVSARHCCRVVKSKIQTTVFRNWRNNIRLGGG